MDLNFYNGKKVLVTGHTGFKGSWLCKILLKNGAILTGYGLKPAAYPNLFEISNLDKEMNSVIGDIRDLQNLLKVFKDFEPEIVIHMAAQPIVRDSYENPVYTYETNVMGTVNILECVRLTSSVKSLVNVTTDKVYKNNEWDWGYRENDPLNGFDPYSNSKSCSELVTDSYKSSFFMGKDIAISTARAGNVIGGGDFANDRIIPDCVRAVSNKKDIEVRNPNSTRPYQHVLEPVFAYLMLAEKQYLEPTKYAGSYNIGPDDCDCVTTGELVNLFCEKWGENIKWQNLQQMGPHEANFLKLDCSKIKNVFQWNPCWNVGKAVENTVQWTKVYYNNMDINECMNKQIDEYLMDRSK